MLLSPLPQPILFQYQAPKPPLPPFLNQRHTSSRFPLGIQGSHSHRWDEDTQGRGHLFPEPSPCQPWPWEIQRPHLPRKHLLRAAWTRGAGNERWPRHSCSRHPISARPRLRARGDRKTLTGRCVQQPQTLDRAFCEDEHFSGVQNHHLISSSKPFRATGLAGNSVAPKQQCAEGSS